MSVDLPTGWINFNGGGSDPTLCGEPQDCPEPPCGPIPEVTITPVDGGGAPLELSCVLGDHELELEIHGGTPPFIWAANGGIITETGGRTAVISIHENGPVAFYRIFARHYNTFCPGQQVCDPYPNTTRLETAVTVYLLAFDCMDVQLSFFEIIPDQILDLRPNAASHPIGDNPDDRTCVLSYDGGGVVLVEDLSDPVGWSVSTTRCVPAIGSVGVTLSAILAGKNGINGTIWSGAPQFSQIFSYPLTESCPQPPILAPIGPFAGAQTMDVRTQAIVDTACCVVPAGSDIIVTVIDANDMEAVIVIPVV